MARMNGHAVELRCGTEVHPKVWGEEHWIVNGAYCGKKLFLRQGRQCSLHFHKNKDETFYVQSGRVRLELGPHPDHIAVDELGPGDSVHILPYRIHRFYGVEDSEIFEFSTHHDEADSYRLEPSK